MVEFHSKVQPNVKKKTISWLRDILKPFNIIYAVIIVAFQKDSKIKDMFQTYDTPNVFLLLLSVCAIFSKNGNERLHHMFVQSNFFYPQCAEFQLTAQTVPLWEKLFTCVKLVFCVIKVLLNIRIQTKERKC